MYSCCHGNAKHISSFGVACRNPFGSVVLCIGRAVSVWWAGFFLVGGALSVWWVELYMSVWWVELYLSGGRSSICLVGGALSV